MHCFLTQRPLSPEDNHTNVSEEAPYTWQPCQHALCPARHRSCKWPMVQEPRLTTLGQLCAAPLVSQSQPAASQPGLEPDSLLSQLALCCSALDYCATREALHKHFLIHHIYCCYSLRSVTLSIVTVYTASTPITSYRYTHRLVSHVYSQFIITHCVFNPYVIVYFISALLGTALK
jgi:hypothetical protein